MLACKLFIHLNALLQNSSLLLFAQSRYDFMAVPMQADLMACIPNLCASVRKAFDRMRRDIEGAFDIVLVKESEQASQAHVSAE